MKSLLRTSFILLGLLPLGLMHAIGVLVGTLLWLTPNKPRRMTLHHLALCLPELNPAQRNRLARRSLVQSACSIFELPAIWYGPRGRLQRWLNQSAAGAQLRALHAGGKGVILLCPHIGAWELAGMFCAANGPMTSLYKPQKGALDALILEGRERLGARLVPTAGKGVKALLQALAQREMIGILPDHDPPEGAGVFAPLFGIPAHTTALVNKLATRSGAPVWFCVAERLPWARGFRIHLRPLPTPLATVEAGAAALNLAIEQVVRDLPEQYWWSYKRFRRLPPGTPDPYQGL
ncbi:MAG: lysophospholipid acyltransferase family protein [Stenotrophobium sp.]